MNGTSDDQPTNPPLRNQPGRHRSRPLGQPQAAAVPLHARARNDNDPVSGPHALGSVSIEHRHGCAVVVASGEFDLTTAPALGHALKTTSQEATKVVVDMSLVTFIDSSGLAVLLDAHRHRQPGHQIALCLGSTATMVRRVLATTHMDTILPTYDTLAEAMAGLAGHT